MLTDCIEAYLTLDDEQGRAFEQLLRTPPYQEIMPLMTTTFEKGMQKGQRQLLRRLLDKKFGPLSPAVQQRLEDWPADRLEELSLAVLDAPSLRALGLEE